MSLVRPRNSVVQAAAAPRRDIVQHDNKGVCAGQAADTGLRVLRVDEDAHAAQRRHLQLADRRVCTLQQFVRRVDAAAGDAAAEHLSGQLHVQHTHQGRPR